MLLPFLEDLKSLRPVEIEDALDWMPARWHHTGKIVAKHLAAILSDFDTFSDNLLGAAAPP